MVLSTLIRETSLNSAYLQSPKMAAELILKVTVIFLKEILFHDNHKKGKLTMPKMSSLILLNLDKTRT